MQFSFNTVAALALIPAVRIVLAQHEAAPSPTNSYGCEPHGDHWHCEGPITPTAAQVITSTPAVAPVITTAPAAASTSSAVAEEHSHEEDEHEHEHEEDHLSGTGSLAPSPTNSFGCEPHGDHWHCEGPKTVLTSVAPTRVISNTTSAPTISPTTSLQSLLPTGGAVSVGASVFGGLLGLLGALAL